MMMEYQYKDIEKISNYKTWPRRKKVDALLSIDCNMYTQLGRESSSRERKETKIKSKNIYKTIGKVNPRLGKLFLQSMDN